MRCHYAPIRKAKIPNTDITKCYDDAKQEELLCISGGNTIWGSLTKTNTLLLCDPTTMFSGFLKGVETYVSTTPAHECLQPLCS